MDHIEVRYSAEQNHMEFQKWGKKWGYNFQYLIYGVFFNRIMFFLSCMEAKKLENHGRKLLQNYFHVDVSLFLQAWVKTYGWVVLCFSSPWKWNSGVPSCLWLLTDSMATTAVPEPFSSIERCHWCPLHVFLPLLSSLLGWVLLDFCVVYICPIH